MFKARGGKSAHESAVRDELANVMRGESNVQPELAGRYADQIVKAAGGDVNQARATCMWVNEAAGVPMNHCTPVSRALASYLKAGMKSVGAKPVRPGGTVAPDVGLRLPSGEIVMQVAVLPADRTQRGDGLTQPGACTALGVKLVTARFIQLLGRQEVRQNVSSTSEYELLWEQAVSATVNDIQSEFGLQEVTGTFDQMDQMCKVLFLRELKSKAVRILAHKKRKVRSKKNK